MALTAWGLLFRLSRVQAQPWGQETPRCLELDLVSLTLAQGADALVTQEFQLSITAVGDHRYLVRTEDVAVGVPLAEEQVVWPVDDWLHQAQQLMHDPLLTLWQGGTLTGLEETGTALPTEELTLTTLGRGLYQAVFHGRLRDSWLAAQGVAQNRREFLRLRLGLKDSQLQRLPWEVLYNDARPLTTGTELTFSRYLAVSGTTSLTALPPLPQLDQPLRVLMVVSAPDDQERLALRQEVEQLQEELQGTAAASQLLDIQLTILEQPGRRELAQALEQGQFQVLHYAGHSDLGETGGDLYLVNHQTGLTERLSGEDLAGLLVNNGIYLAVFNSCRGAYTATDDATAGWCEQNLVQALNNRGVPSVVAMAERIPDDVAITFTRLLYRNLRRHYPIDLCLSRTRQALASAHGSDQFYWALPILYMHPEFNGYLTRCDRSQAAPLDPWSLPPVWDELSRELDPDLTPDESATALTDTDWLDDLPPEDGATDYDDDSAAVADILQQLSRPGTKDEPPLLARDEDLQPSTDVPDPYRDLPENPALSDPGASTAKAEPGTATTASPQPGSRRWLAMAGLSLAAMAAVGIGIASQAGLFSRLSDAPQLPAPASSPPVSQDTAALIPEASAALGRGDLSAATALITTMLDGFDVDSAELVLNRASAEQNQAPEIMYLRGRLHWQQLAQAYSAADLERAQTAWQQATETQDDFLEAYVGLGFAQYEQGNIDAAITAWQRATELDQQQPTATADQTVARPITLNAHAGLAMAYVKKLDGEALSPTERAWFQSQATKHYRLVQAEAPDAFETQTLQQTNWLWLDPALNDWSVAQGYLDDTTTPPAAEAE
ncbi:uncharacterized protein XM38_040620 [Halomicronema hongdechloris C2206]|uniref:CHAT domain-containing protein n=1 Tax=Halomicronema hongdechloris C2206 TaxID=1641165 RepID=A0A1Z3HS12_9CYAN|nr:CHAT domain-containing protein [Halomicronema hongdechloris]ASC73100.1 uncharacterized protein XM38_040620 [Halomicronema hongdechloris C2206]